MVGVPRLPNGRLTKSAALLELLHGEGRRLLRGEFAAAFVRAATRHRGAEAQVTATTLLIPHAPTTGVGALIFVFDQGAGASGGRAGGEREDDGEDTHRVGPVWYNVRNSRRAIRRRFDRFDDTLERSER